jgi:hypothetical protein
MGLDRGLSFRLSAQQRTGEKFFTKNLCKQLKSLDLDERIQGNPTANWGLRSETATPQENPNGSVGPMSRPAAVARAAARTRPGNIDVSSADGEAALSREASVAVWPA